MTHTNRMTPWLVGAAAIAAISIAFGTPLASLLPFAIVLVCPMGVEATKSGMRERTGDVGEDLDAPHRGQGVPRVLVGTRAVGPYHADE